MNTYSYRSCGRLSAIVYRSHLVETDNVVNRNSVGAGTLDGRGSPAYQRQRPGDHLELVGVTAYSMLELGLHANTQQVTLFTTGRLDAVLHDPPPLLSMYGSMGM